jgi:hypothetical protein
MVTFDTIAGYVGQAWWGVEGDVRGQVLIVSYKTVGGFLVKAVVRR